jgi:hypothetical protein
VRKVTIFFLTATIIGLFSLISCSKSNNNTVTTPDSVFTSPWITLVMDSNSNTNQDWEEALTAPAITSAILDDGVVLGYGVILDAVANDNGLWYRYVTVPGHVLATKGLTPVQAKSLSYAEITKLFPPAAKNASSPTIQ